MARRFALLISNSKYKDSKLTTLAAPAGDAKALAEVLKNPQIGAFDEARALVNSSFADIQEAIVAFFAAKKPDDLALLYFSGHGLLDESRKLFLATPESIHNLPRARSIPATFIAEEMSASRAKKQILVLDCCHSGAFSRGVKAAIRQSVGTENIFQTEGAGRVVLTASDATQYAFEGDNLVGDGVRSVFTNYLIEGLENGTADLNNDGLISVDDWYQYAYDNVRKETPNQTPMKWSYGQQGQFPLARNPFAVSVSLQAATVRPADSSVIQPPAEKRVQTLVVDQLMRGDFETITAAIQNANPGDRILIHEGIYEETLIIDKVLEIIGDGQLGDVEIRASENNVIVFQAGSGAIRNLVLRQTGGDFFAVDIPQGRLRLENCDISSEGWSCIGIHNNGTTPFIRGNKIHDGKQNGIFMYKNGQGSIEANEIWGNAYSGIEITTGATPTIRNNKIHDGKQGGVYVHDNGQGLIEANEIWGNALAGIDITAGAIPTIRNNKIHDGKQSGISVYENGQGLIEANEIWGNAFAGIIVVTDSTPTIRNNKIYDGKQSGIYVYENGQGLIEANEILGNTNSGIVVKTGARPTVRGNTISENKNYAIYAHEKGGGIFENNDLRGNTKGAWLVKTDSRAYVTKKNNIE